MAAETTARRDTIVVGGSAGAFTALDVVLESLDAGLEAALLVVLHVTRTSWAVRADLLRRRTALRVAWAEDGRRIEPGCVYLAPPDHHLVLPRDADHMVVMQGPFENRCRPAINPLFRSAAAHRGSRTIAVLLSGLLDDGVAGLRAVQRCGGVTIVQDPKDAESPDMPRAALDAMEPDHVTSAAEIGPLLMRLLGETVQPAEIPPDVVAEARVFAVPGPPPPNVPEFGRQVSLTCPECDGPLWQVGEGGASIYRCFVGHGASARALLEGQGMVFERAMWSAVRALAERSQILGRMAADAKQRGHPSTAREFELRAAETGEEAEQARQFLLRLIGAGQSRLGAGDPVQPSAAGEPAAETSAPEPHGPPPVTTPPPGPAAGHPPRGRRASEK